HSLVELGIGAADLQPDVLAQFLRDVPHDALKALEGFADRHHADFERAIADLLDQRGNGGHGLLGRAITVAPGRELRGRARDDQLAYQIDQRIELVGLHPDVLARVTQGLAYLTLLAERDVNHLGLDRAALDQHFANRRGLPISRVVA